MEIGTGFMFLFLPQNHERIFYLGNDQCRSPDILEKEWRAEEAASREVFS